jgi:hypothetical protein
MARPPEQISPHFVGNGGSHKALKVFHVYEHNVSQVHRLHWWKLLLQSMLPSSSQALSIPSGGPLDWHTFCTTISLFTQI